MNQQQHGVYQPAMDKVPIYDLSDEEIEEEEHSRLPLLIIIGLVALAAFAGVVWLAYNQGVARGRTGAGVVIAAPSGPDRTAPGGIDPAASPFAGLKVYEQPVPPDVEAATTVITQAPAQPEATKPVASNAAPASAANDTPPMRLNSDNPPAAATRPQQAPQAPPPVVQAQRTAPPAAPPSVPAPSAAVPAQRTAPPAAVPPASPPPAPAPAANQTAAASAAVSGKAVLQIGSYESVEIANGAWNRFRTRYADVVGTLTQDVQKADLGAKGIWYRLRAGPFAERSAAVAACEKLRTEGGSCIVTAP